MIEFEAFSGGDNRAWVVQVTVRNQVVSLIEVAA